MKDAQILVGCAGWALPAIARDRFPDEGSILKRYAAKLPGGGNQFIVLPTPQAFHLRAMGRQRAGDVSLLGEGAEGHHTRGATRLGTGTLLDAFVAEVSALGPRLGCLLVQLPPSLTFDAAIAGAFFGALREGYAGMAVLEPRHPTWFTAEAERQLVAQRIARVAADPAISLEASEPGGWPDVVYYRLHGSPRVYYSAYDKAYLDRLATNLRAHALTGTTTYCIFDNTRLARQS
jgi:uncharacterized protein YecE (DUF72 family)